MRRLALGLIPLAIAVLVAYRLATPPEPIRETPPTSPVTGVLVKVDSTGLGSVQGFRIRMTGGKELEFAIGALENGDVFPPGHLAEHLSTSDPIRVYFRADGDRLVAYRLEDASAPAAT